MRISQQDSESGRIIVETCLSHKLRGVRLALRERHLIILASLSDTVIGLGSHRVARSSAPVTAHLHRCVFASLHRTLVDLLRLILQAVHLPVLSIRRARREPAPKRWVQAMGVSQVARGGDNGEKDEGERRRRCA